MGLPENEKMVANTIVGRGIRDTGLIDAFLRIDRAFFVPDRYIEGAYEDGPLSIGRGQTISQPYMVALMTELLEISSEDRVLEIGTGSGYQTAILASVARDVYTVERIESLSAKASLLLGELGFENIHYRVGDGFEGWPEHEPFDAIIVTASPEDIPEKLLSQLSSGGRMVIPIGRTGGNQVLCRFRRQRNGYSAEEICDVRFVPMIKGVEQELQE